MNDLGRLYNDLITTAKLVEAPYSETVIQQFLKTFEAGFSRGAIQFRTTTKSRRRLDVRFEELNAPQPPLSIARRAGLLPDQGRDIDRIIPQLYEHYPYMGDGADFDVSEGLTKLWFFSLGGVTIDQAFPLSAMPRSVAGHAWFYEKYRLSRFGIVGVDYRSESLNLYLRLDQPSFHHTPEVIRGIVEDLGFATPPDEAVTYNFGAISVALTYRWDSPEIDRVCFYVPRPNRETAPRAVHPMIQRFVDQVPMLKDPIYVVSYTFGTEGTYLKMENDYTGNTIDVIGRTQSDDVSALV